MVLVWHAAVGSLYGTTGVTGANAASREVRVRTRTSRSWCKSRSAIGARDVPADGNQGAEVVCGDEVDIAWAREPVWDCVWCVLW